MYIYRNVEASTVVDAEGQLSEAETFIRLIRRKSVWWLCPYGWWQEDDDSYVIFDRAYRPIFRVHLNGDAEIVRSDEFIQYRTQRWLHRGFGSRPDDNTKCIVVDLIARYNLAPELRRRRELLRRGQLPRWSH